MSSNKMVNCPTCESILVYPRVGGKYCEDCGWPDEDFGEEFVYPSIGDRLEDYQPKLEFFNGVSWVKSGIIFGTMQPLSIGLYRSKVKVA